MVKNGGKMVGLGFRVGGKMVVRWWQMVKMVVRWWQRWCQMVKMVVRWW